MRAKQWSDFGEQRASISGKAAVHAEAVLGWNTTSDGGKVANGVPGIIHGSLATSEAVEL